MDVAAITSLIMSIMTPLLPIVGTAMLTKASEDVYDKTKEQSKRLYEAIHARFAHENDGGNASQALQTFASGDADYSIVVEKKLLNILQSDGAFASQLSAIIQSGPRQSLTAAEEAKASRIRMNNSLGKGTQDINLGRNATADDVQFNIGNEKMNQ